MSDSPYIPFYTSDFLGGTSGLTASTKGVYITLLCLMYDEERPLPQQWDTLARRCGCTLPAFKKAIQSLIDDEKITVLEDGLWSPKCDKHLTQRCERRNSAKGAAKTRWEKSKQKQSKSNANASSPQCQPEPEPDIRRDTNVSLAREAQNEFEQFWDVVPRKVGKGAARKAYAKARKVASFSEIIDGIARYARQREGQDEQYTCHPASWLNQERWLDEAAPTQADFHNEIDRLLKGNPHGLPDASENDYGQGERLPAPEVSTPSEPRQRGQADGDTGYSGRDQRAHLSLIKPKRFGGTG